MLDKPPITLFTYPENILEIYRLCNQKKNQYDQLHSINFMTYLNITIHK